MYNNRIQSEVRKKIIYLEEINIAEEESDKLMAKLQFKRRIVLGLKLQA